MIESSSTQHGGFSQEGYQLALDFLYGRINYERTARGVPSGSHLNLDRMRRLLAELGNPQESLKAIHIAGTKGKGSTAAMISSVLTNAGYRTGLFTSPHLKRLEERIQIDGIDCSPAELVALVEAVRGVVDKLDHESQDIDGPGKLTFFEITTAMALLHFTHHKVDAAILEVGLGGRLDSTNLCHQVITVITSISFDHMQQLGNTLAAIAREKAGIIKPGVPLVCGVTQDEAFSVIKSIATERAAPMSCLGTDFDFEYTAPPLNMATDSGGSIKYCDSISPDHSPLEHVSVGMRGVHQATNAAIAIATLRQLQTDGWSITESAIREGIAAARCRARIEVVARNPIVILDTAHNVASIDALLAALDESFHSKRRTLIFAATRDKDISGMLRQLLPRFDSVILTRYIDNPRGVAPERLLELSDKLSADLTRMPDITVCDTPVDAWQKCQATTKSDDVICVTGSFYLAIEMRSMIATSR